MRQGSLLSYCSPTSSTKEWEEIREACSEGRVELWEYGIQSTQEGEVFIEGVREGGLSAPIPPHSLANQQSNPEPNDHGSECITYLI